MERSGSKYLTSIEKERFDAMARFASIKEAATILDVTPQTLYNWRSNVRKRYRKERGHINAVLAQTRRGGCLKDLLVEKRKMKAPDEEEEEEEW